MVFTGIEDVDWASMNHAYGDAADVPDLLRGLASADPAERDVALDGMYGAVHHQGDVYDSTVACIPFLFDLVGRSSVEDRGSVVGLLRSIAGEEEPDPEEIGGLFEDEEEDAAWVANFVDAAAIIRGRAGFFLEFVADPDPGLRAAVPGALTQLHADPARVFAVLRSRLDVERDGDVVRSLATAVGRLGVEHAELRPEAGRCLAEVVASGGADPELRLKALAQLARYSPELLPEDSVDIAVEVMRIAHEAEPAAAEAEPAAAETGPVALEAEPERPRTDTMVSYLRDLEAAHRASIDARLADDLLRDLHIALDDRTQERFGLLHAQLCTADWGQRMAAVRESGLLLTGWRAPNDLAVALLARQLVEHDEELSRATLSELAHVHPIAGVTADVLEACLIEWEDDWDPADWQDSLFGGVLKALALQGDARAVPYLAAVLEDGGVPENLGGWMEAIGPAEAARLAPLLHDRLAAVPPSARGESRQRLIGALGVLSPAASLPLIIDAARGDRGGMTQWAALRALARYGPSATEAAPLLRELTSDGASGHRAEAASALWAVTGEAAAVVPALSAVLAGDRWYEREIALRVARAMGSDAATLVPCLRGLLTAQEQQGLVAAALWRIRADAQEVLPVLLEAWTATPTTRPSTAACLLEMGPAALPALPLVRRELASTRRHNNYGAEGNMRYDVVADEQLLQDCRRVAAALER
ncbi:HEAT repeat domain-containing protein [Streptomyces sp. NBC_01381]|uniref:HEAT repeat domain-containing protein n=1 Tax=Streptomyces sp. NBC_01381 TaxID=2903845 RepID=UPI00224F6198|nr:HEAT repeat domain-containing protein [Streptomyces sp. NBC_01381]MCX4671588.1 HEAT repeat domain-containing protein [Streptomyces sp. NBC_01381]